MNGMKDLFIISEYQNWTKEGHQVYGIRGIGETYKKFWKSFNYNVVWKNDDWPWSYVALTKEDEVRFRSDWKDHIEVYESDDDDDDEHDEPIDRTPPSEAEVILSKILAEEIDKEINKSIIEEISKAAKKDA